MEHGYAISVLNDEGEKVAEYLFGLHVADVKYLAECFIHMKCLLDFVYKTYGSRPQDMDRFLITFGERFPKYHMWLEQGKRRRLRWYSREKELKNGHIVDMRKVVMTKREEDNYLFSVHFSNLYHLVTQFHKISTIYEFACWGDRQKCINFEFFRKKLPERLPEYWFFVRRDAAIHEKNRRTQHKRPKRMGMVIKGNFGSRTCEARLNLTNSSWS